MTNTNEDDYGLEPLQQKIMEVMVHVHQICVEHGIKYYAIDGTAIGAVRHQGFIPWDDDLDIGMPFEDYNKFIRVCESALDKDRFYLQKEFTSELPKPFCKVRMNNTTYIEAVNPEKGMHQGVFIDVKCLHQAPDSGMLRRIQFLAAKVVSARGLAMVRYQPNSLLKKVFIKCMALLPQRFVFGTVAGFVARWNGTQTDYVGHIYSRARYGESYFPSAMCGTPELVPFENAQIFALQDSHAFLATRYGDYMALPPEKERIAAQHAETVDLERDYKFYTHE